MIQSGWGQLPLSLKAKLNQTVVTWEFPVSNVYLLVWAFSLSWDPMMKLTNSDNPVFYSSLQLSGSVWAWEWHPVKIYPVISNQLLPLHVAGEESRQTMGCTVNNIRISVDILWRVFHILTKPVPYTFVNVKWQNNDIQISMDIWIYFCSVYSLPERMTLYNYLFYFHSMIGSVKQYCVLFICLSIHLYVCLSHAPSTKRVHYSTVVTVEL